ncbi:hypothetical protein MBLNU457_5114t1 [Dothideomycetes sp. NU457]
MTAAEPQFLFHFDDSSSTDQHSYNVFQPPPVTPGSASSSGFLSDKARRRTRPSARPVQASKRNSWLTPDTGSWLDTSIADIATPAPLANERYQLDGGFDTPSLAAATRSSLQSDADVTYFCTGRPIESVEQLSSYDVLAKERNGVGRLPLESTPAPRWTSLALGLVSAAAGKMFDFCRKTVFSGFYAGGGQGYNQDFSASPKLFNSHGSVIPGQFPDDDFLGDFEQDNTPLRPAKRRQVDTAAGWIVVDPDLQTRDEDSTRLSNRKTSASLLSASGGDFATTASKVSPRTSLAPVSRSKVSSTGVMTATGSPRSFTQPVHSRRTSNAHNRSPSRSLHWPSMTNLKARSPNARISINGMAENESLTPEAQKYLKRNEKRDRDADKAMRKMSSQIQDLIRQGQQALGTKFSVEDETTDGFEEVGEEYGDFDDGFDEGFESGGDKW